MKKYCLHAGWITSRNDGDIHFITTRQLHNLYNLKTEEYVVCMRCHRDIPGTSPKAMRCESYNEKYVHLFPRHDGNYDR